MGSSTDTRVVQVKLRDEVSSGLKTMNRSLKEVQTGLSSTVKGMIGLGVSISAGQVIVQGLQKVWQTLKQVIKESVQEYFKSEQELSKMNSVLRATGGALGYTTAELQKMAAQMMRGTIFDDEQIMAAQTFALTMEGISKETFPRMMQVAADLATVMGTDLESAVSQLGIAMQDPENGLTRLRRAGIVFSESQKTLIKSLVDTGQAAAAQNIILTELESRVGGAAAAMGTTVFGSVEKLKNELNNMKESLGQLIALGMKPFLDYLIDIRDRTAETAEAIATLNEKLKFGGLTLPKYLLDEALPKDLAQRVKTLMEASDASYIIAMNATQMQNYRAEVVALIAALEKLGLTGSAAYKWLFPQAPARTSGGGAGMLPDTAERYQYTPWQGGLVPMTGAELQTYLFEGISDGLATWWDPTPDVEQMLGRWAAIDYTTKKALEAEQRTAEYNKVMAQIENDRFLKEQQARTTGQLAAVSTLTGGGGLEGMVGDVLSQAANTLISQGALQMGASLGEQITLFFEQVSSGLDALVLSLGKTWWIILIIIAAVEILKGIMEILGPANNAVLKPVFDGLKAIGNALGTLLLPILEALGPVTTALVQGGLNVLLPLLTALIPVFRVLGFVIALTLVPLQVLAWTCVEIVNRVIDLVNDFIRFFNPNAVGLPRLPSVTVTLPTWPTFHEGGTATSDMLAILRKDEEVLSPTASRNYRDGVGGGITINAPNARYLDGQTAADLVALGLSTMRR